MIKTLLSIVLIIILIPVYIFNINLIANYENTDSQIELNNNQYKGFCNASICEKVGMSDSVSIEVVKNRWYGKIVENSDQNGNLNNLYLFKIIKIPTNKNGFSFFWIHISFLIFLIIIFLSMFLWDILSKSQKIPKIPKTESYYYLTTE